MSIEQTGFTNYFAGEKTQSSRINTAETISNYRQENISPRSNRYLSATPLASNLHKVFGNRTLIKRGNDNEIDINDLPDPYKDTKKIQAAAHGAREGKEAYRRFKESKSDNRDQNSEEHENPQEYWKNYWRNYWKSYYEDYYKQPEKLETSDSKTGRDQGTSIHEVANSKVGQKLWQGSRYEQYLQNGKLGSAASVAEILKSLGYSYATSPGVAKLAQQLLGRGWKPVSLKELRPGDVIYGGKNSDWQKGGGNAHMAVVGQKGFVLHNNSDTGVFTSEKIGGVFDAANYGDRIWALRPPQNGPQSKADIPVRREVPEVDDRPGSIIDTIGQGARNIVKAAVNSVGKAMFLPMLSWSMGRLGCAASVSGVLKKAGYSYAHHAGVYGLSQQLIKNGWQKLEVSQAQPGDVVIGIRRSSWKNGGGGSHIGIVGDGNTSYHNSSARKQWFKGTLSYWNTSRYPRGVFVLRAPSRNA